MIRRVFPPTPRYELFNVAVLVGVFGFVGYVIFAPPAETAKALAAPLRIITETQLGWAMTAAAVIGIVGAYTGGQLFDLGRAGLLFVCGALVTYAVVGGLAGAPERGAILNAFLYGFLFRCAWRARRSDE